MNKKPYSEACDQNRDPILAVLKDVLRDNDTLLEVGSGTGQHAAYFPRFLPHITWQPSDVAANLAGIESWRLEADLTNVLPAVTLDVNQLPWQVPPVSAVFSANTAHILSWFAVTNLFKGVSAALEDRETAIFCLYGPFNYDGQYTSASNASFDQWLKARDPESGIRDIADLKQLATVNRLELGEDIEMPINNRLLTFKRTNE